MIQLTITPKTSLADQPVKIHVSGLAPGLLVTLQSSLTDERGITFQARALYRADEAGQVDLEKAAALGGDYAGVWPMGLFWFLKPEKLFQRLIKKDVMGSPFQVRIDLFDSFLLMPQVQAEPVASCTVERWYVTPGTQRIPIKEGRVRGTLFLPPGEKTAPLCPFLPLSQESFGELLPSQFLGFSTLLLPLYRPFVPLSLHLHLPSQRIKLPTPTAGLTHIG